MRNTILKRSLPTDAAILISATPTAHGPSRNEFFQLEVRPLRMTEGGSPIQDEGRSNSVPAVT